MKMIDKGIHGTCNYKCTKVCDSQLNPTSSSDMCTTEFQIYKGLTEFQTFILCPKLALVEWHSKQCLMGECSHCGVHTLKVCPNELEIDQIIHKQNIGYKIVGQIKDGRDQKASKVEYHDTHSSELIQYLKPHLKAFVFHNFISRWQDVQFKDCLFSVLEDTIKSCVDFSKNYTLMVQNEI